MKCFQLSGALLAYTISVVAVALVPSRPNTALQQIRRSFDDDLRLVLSPEARISHQLSAAPRWSEYYAPRPGTIIDVATESDVQAVVWQL